MLSAPTRQTGSHDLARETLPSTRRGLGGAAAGTARNAHSGGAIPTRGAWLGLLASLVVASGCARWASEPEAFACESATDCLGTEVCRPASPGRPDKLCKERDGSCAFDADCEGGQVCVSAVKEGDGYDSSAWQGLCKPVGTTCYDLADCKPNQYCAPAPAAPDGTAGRCREAACATETEALVCGGFRCSAARGICLESCSVNTASCARGFTCIEATERCVKTCKSTADCEPYACDADSHLCRTHCTQDDERLTCAAGHECSAAGACE